MDDWARTNGRAEPGTCFGPCFGTLGGILNGSSAEINARARRGACVGLLKPGACVECGCLNADDWARTDVRARPGACIEILGTLNADD